MSAKPRNNLEHPKIFNMLLLLGSDARMGTEVRLPKALTLEHFEILSGPGGRMGKAALETSLKAP
jgi:hypothetical protein